MQDQAPSWLAETPRGITYDEWRYAFALAKDFDEVMRAVRLYLSAWSFEQIRELPPDVGSLTVEGPEDVITRAVLASRAEINAPAEADTALLREMALTLSAAATRLRWLKANVGVSA